jgi:predicted unusual protein kinase regulating ubiquinone biosynthesis (AarF/ABC1/UbiB family)
VDVLSPELIKELEKLQDNVPPFGVEEAKAIIANDLGAPVHEKYSYFEDQPIAAASLGQVRKRPSKIIESKAIKSNERPSN